MTLAVGQQEPEPGESVDCLKGAVVITQVDRPEADVGDEQYSRCRNARRVPRVRRPAH